MPSKIAITNQSHQLQVQIQLQSAFDNSDIETKSALRTRDKLNSIHQNIRAENSIIDRVLV